MKLLLTSLFLGLGCSSASFADEHRYISIRNTDSVWTLGECSLVFRPGNGGVGEFSNLSVTIQLKDKAGQTLSEGTLDMPPFGDSDATRAVDTATEFDCEVVDKARTINIVEASEISGNNTIVKLTLSATEDKGQPPRIVRYLKVTMAATAS
ncbi:Uncharacterised protein [Yersinia intermedia]|uniref:Lipoprotein n=1 Tax=Yersinia intermedia TaxID=631 RepID=A0A0T9N3D5_YERIN|nr:IrmA family protein [Yersinia intermedia]CNG74406.1 Uncharacterised protein [Yersinia intermedia]CNK41119.1 Uncharacterised protein [Yersinia intermedia]